MPGQEDNELVFHDLAYRFAGEEEMEDFKNNTKDYIREAPLQVPPPKIGFIGIRGSGVHT